MAFSLTVARSGPGIIVAWPAVAGAEAYIVSRARRESLSFHPLETGCCPEVRRVSPQPDFDLPCCPVAPSRTSLQVEGLEPGMSYRFHVLAVGTTNVSSASSEPIAAASLPGPPGPVEVARNDASIVDLRWPAGDDGGDAVVGYQLLAQVRTAVWQPTHWRVLVANTSSARLRVDALALLPSAHYRLAVRASNSVGLGAMSVPAPFATAAAPAAVYELPIGRWGHATVHRGATSRHRFFVPAATAACRVTVQLHALHSRVLLQVERGGEPTLLLPEDLPIRTEPGVWNASTDDGSLSLELAYPASDWYYLLMYARALAPAAAVGADVRVSVATGVEEAIEALGTEARYDDLEPPWRYAIDPEGRSEYDPWVLKRAMNPLSAVPSG